MPPLHTARSPSRFTLLTLGRASLIDGSGAVIGEQRRRVALLALVAAAGERGVSRDKLLAWLSPESDTASARHSLHQLLYYLRRQIGSDAFRGTDPIRLDPQVVTTDFAEFEAALDTGMLEEAAALYRGPFLDGFHVGSAGFDDWAEGERARLASRLAEALVRLAMAADGRGDQASAIKWWRRLTTLDPLSGRYAFGLIRALEMTGDVTGAVRHATAHQTFVRADVGAPCSAEVSAALERLTRRSSGTPPRFTPPSQVRRLVVLPLATTTADFGHIAEGVTRELISALTIAGVRVIGYQSAAKYSAARASLREMAKALDVDGVATGRLDRRGNTIALALDVANPSSGENVWATSVVVDSSEISRLATTTARRLAAWILGADAESRIERMTARPLTSVEAYTSYLLAMRRVARGTGSDMREAIADLEHAIIADATFAPAYAGLAYVATVAVDYALLPADEAFRRAEPAIARALELDPNLALAHSLARGCFSFVTGTGLTPKPSTSLR